MPRRTWYLMAGAGLWVVSGYYMEDDAVFWSCYVVGMALLVCWGVDAVKSLRK